MVYWYLMAVVYSSWDGSVVRSTKAARFETQIECVEYLDSILPQRRKAFLCLPDATEIKETK